MGVYIAIKSTVDAFKFGVDVPAPWFVNMGKDISYLRIPIEGEFVDACDIHTDIGTMRAVFGDYIGRFPDNTIQVFKEQDFHKIYTLKV